MRAHFKKGARAKAAGGQVGVVKEDATAEGHEANQVRLQLSNGSTASSLKLDTLSECSAEEYEQRLKQCGLQKRGKNRLSCLVCGRRIGPKKTWEMHAAEPEHLCKMRHIEEEQRVRQISAKEEEGALRTLKLVKRNDPSVDSIRWGDFKAYRVDDAMLRKLTDSLVGNQHVHEIILAATDVRSNGRTGHGQAKPLGNCDLTDVGLAALGPGLERAQCAVRSVTLPQFVQYGRKISTPRDTIDVTYLPSTFSQEVVWSAEEHIRKALWPMTLDRVSKNDATLTDIFAMDDSDLLTLVKLFGQCHDCCIRQITFGMKVTANAISTLLDALERPGCSVNDCWQMERSGFCTAMHDVYAGTYIVHMDGHQHRGYDWYQSTIAHTEPWTPGMTFCESLPSESVVPIWAFRLERWRCNRDITRVRNNDPANVMLNWGLKRQVLHDAASLDALAEAIRVNTHVWSIDLRCKELVKGELVTLRNLPPSQAAFEPVSLESLQHSLFYSRVMSVQWNDKIHHLPAPGSLRVNHSKTSPSLQTRCCEYFARNLGALSQVVLDDLPEEISSHIMDCVHGHKLCFLNTIKRIVANERLPNVHKYYTAFGYVNERLPMDWSGEGWQWIDEDVLTQLAESLALNEHVSSVKLPFERLGQFVYGNDYNSEDLTQVLLKRLVERVAENDPTLTELRLGLRHVDEATAKGLATALRSNTIVRKLTFNDKHRNDEHPICRLSQEAMLALAAAVPNSAVQELVLYGASDDTCAMLVSPNEEQRWYPMPTCSLKPMGTVMASVPEAWPSMTGKFGM